MQKNTDIKLFACGVDIGLVLFAKKALYLCFLFDKISNYILKIINSLSTELPSF